MRWIGEAGRRGYDALVFLIDEDGIRKRVHEIRKAQQDSSIFSFPRAMGVAIRTFDAWILADEKALSQVLGYTVQKQLDPENTRVPKQACTNLLKKSPNSMAQRDMYASVTEQIDIEILAQRCQTGFKPFTENVKRIFQ